MSQIERVIDGMQRMSLLAQLRDKVAYAHRAPQCGDCHWWMKSRDCPREKNVGGMTRGPSAGGTPCNKYQETEASKQITKDRVTDAVDFARKYGLPVPTHLQQ